MDFKKICKSWNLCPGTETLQQISELWVKCKKSYWDSKLHPSCLTPLVLSIFNLPCQFWGVIIFERVISLCWNFQDHHISYIPLIWKGFIKIWDGSCLNFEILVPLTWNNPNAWKSSIRKCPSHASIENRHSKKIWWRWLRREKYESSWNCTFNF